MTAHGYTAAQIDLRLSGHYLARQKITLKATQGDVTLDGPVDYTVPEQPQPPEPAAPSVSKAMVIDALSDDTKDQSVNKDKRYQDITIDVVDAFGGALGQHRSAYNGLCYRITTDVGAVRTGQVKDGKIQEAGVALKQRYRLELLNALASDKSEDETDSGNEQ